MIEKDGVRRVGLDAGMNALIRPALYDAWHDIDNLTRLDDARCDGVRRGRPDLRIQRRVRPAARRCPRPPREGDVMLFADAGAYGMAMANTYNLRAAAGRGRRS